MRISQLEFALAEEKINQLVIMQIIVAHLFAFLRTTRTAILYYTFHQGKQRDILRYFGKGLTAKIYSIRLNKSKLMSSSLLMELTCNDDIS